jgi:carboxyl-terminal processing protease
MMNNSAFRFIRIVAIVVCCALALGVAAFSGKNDALYFKIAKSLAIFGELFRQVSNDYVDDLDPQEFIEAGIEGMLKHLDPYTVYIDDESHDEVDILTTGVYGGLGITTALIDSVVTITGISEGSPAEQAGLRVGDVMYMIDTAVVLRASSYELRKHTRGKPGTALTVRVLRTGRSDTLLVKIVRQEVTLKNVSYSGVISGDANGSAAEPVGYIRLERFTHGAPAEVVEAINDIRKAHPSVKGWILDVRDNPGGLLDAAVGVCEAFVPNGSLIVSTRGRVREQERSYYSDQQPLEPDKPLIVLTSQHSASASEIVAAAIQDLDRGIVLGEPSFGKGLVQTISNLPYNASLKMTTAKYYTPSGRCIQKIDYSKRRHDIVKLTVDTTTTYKTLGGRTVRGFAGVQPDTTVSLELLSPVLEELVEHRAMFLFANNVAGSRSSIPKDFVVSKQLFAEFLDYVRRSGAAERNPALKDLEQLEQTMRAEHASASSLKTLKGMRAQLTKDYFAELERQRAVICDMLREEILQRFYPRSVVIAATLASDVQVRAAADLVRKPSRYKALLAPPNDGKR